MSTFEEQVKAARKWMGSPRFDGIVRLHSARQVAEQTKDVALQPDGWWLVALSARDLDDLDTAKDALKILINKWPRTSVAIEARPVFREVTREIWTGGKTSAPAAPGQ